LERKQISNFIEEYRRNNVAVAAVTPEWEIAEADRDGVVGDCVMGSHMTVYIAIILALIRGNPNSKKLRWNLPTAKGFGALQTQPILFFWVANSTRHFNCQKHRLRTTTDMRVKGDTWNARVNLFIFWMVSMRAIALRLYSTASISHRNGSHSLLVNFGIRTSVH
jgi:hypothetical protein